MEETAAEKHARFTQIHNAVIEELDTHPNIWIGQSKDMNKVLERFKAIEHKVPMMRVIHGKIIEKIGHIPRSSETDEEGNPYWEPLSKVLTEWKPTPIEDKGIMYARPIFNFLSHRWSSPRAPDDDDNSKATIVAKLTQYGRNVYQTDMYWWIDFTCANQDDTVGHIATLPLYVAASEETFSVYTPGGDYDHRGWIRCERALSAALNSPRAWKYVPYNYQGEIPTGDEWWLLNDPAEGQISVEGDRIYLDTISRLALKMWPVSYSVNWRSTGNQYSDWGYADRLEYGKTRIFTWHMNSYSG